MTTRTQFAALVAALIPEIKGMDKAAFDAVTGRLRPGDPQAFTGRIARTADPAAFRGRAWVNELVDGEEAARLCGYSQGKTWPIYRGRARRALRNGITDLRLMPAPVRITDRRGEWEHALWEVGELAIWQAVKQSRILTPSRWPDHEIYYPAVEAAVARGKMSRRALMEELGIGGELATSLLKELGYMSDQGIPADALLEPAVRRLIPAVGAPPAPAHVVAALAEQGYEISERTARRLLAQVAPARLPRMEGDTLSETVEVRPATLARYAGITPNAITKAMATCWYCGEKRGARWHDGGYRAGRGEPVPHEFRPWLTPAGRDTSTWLFDPRKIKRVWPLLTPVDADLIPAERNSLRPRKLR